MPFSAAISSMVCGRSPPSRWSWRRTLGSARTDSSSMLMPSRYRPDEKTLRPSGIVLPLVLGNLDELLDDVGLARFLVGQLRLGLGIVVLSRGLLGRRGGKLHDLVRVGTHEAGVAPALRSGKGAHIDLL